MFGALPFKTNPATGAFMQPQVMGANGMNYSTDMLHKYQDAFAAGGANTSLTPFAHSLSSNALSPLEMARVQGGLFNATGAQGYQDMVQRARAMIPAPSQLTPQKR